MKKMKLFFLFAFQFLFVFTVKSQYTINGSATQDNCHCYTLTQNVLTQQGSVWNNTKINLTQSFDFTFQVFLGCTDFNGADGIAFVLQPISTSVGSNGGGMGYQNVSPAVGVTLDTYQNSSPDNDPAYDHIAIQLNGNINHNLPSTLTPLTPISATSDNVEDCQNHTLRIAWDATSKTMTVYFDGQLRVSAVNDFTNTVFSGDPLVYWGFTGATGGLSNLQKFCTSLTPSFHFLPTQTKCVNEPITFYDSTVSFAEPVTRVWDFGDASPIVTGVTNPIHTYTTAGDFTVILTVTSPDGCQEVFTQSVHVGSKPVADFNFTGSCVNTNIQFNSTANAGISTITTWYWDFDNNGQTSNIQNPGTTYLSPGPKTIKHFVKSVEGCASDTLVRIINIQPRPNVDFNFTDSVCLGTPTLFHDLSTVSGGTINYWQWTYNDSTGSAIIQNPSHIFTAPGPHNVTLVTSASASNACAGAAVTHSVFVADKPVAKMKQIIVCERQSVQLQDSSYSTDGLAINSCWWDLGNGQFSNQCNPTVTYTTPGPKTLHHVVYNSRGCKSDTLTVTVNVADKPHLDFTLGTPLCNDSSLHFSDASTVTNGTINQWNWIHNNTSFGSTHDVTGYFPFGNNQVGLSVSSSLGCYTDTIYKTFRLIRNPKIRMNFNDTCKYAPVNFTAAEIAPRIGIQEWHWAFGDGQQSTSVPTSHTYSANGAYNVSLYAISVEGCHSDTLHDVVNIYGTNAFAGNDTICAANQPIQLNASGGVNYQWSPSAGLSAINIPNPIVTIAGDMTYYLKAFTPAGCFSYDTIKITIYKGPDIYVPTAFTPNGDGLNDQLGILPIGLKSLAYFSVYNRYGQMVFTTNNKDKRWDARFKGTSQPAGAYVWMASGTDFLNRPIFKKGTVLLIR